MKIPTLSLLTRAAESSVSENRQSAAETLDRLGLQAGESRLARLLTSGGGGAGQGSGRLILEMNGQQVSVRSDRGVPAESLVRVMRAGNELQLMEIVSNPGRSTLSQALAQKIPAQHHLGEGLGQLLHRQPDSTVPEPARQTLQRLFQMLPRFTGEGTPPQSHSAGLSSRQPMDAAARFSSTPTQLLSPVSQGSAGQTPSLDLSPQEPINAQRVRELIENSGFFREARLLTAPPTGPDSRIEAQPRDLKAQLIQVAVRLAASSGAAGHGVTENSGKAPNALVTQELRTALSQLGASTTPELTGQEALRFPAPMPAAAPASSAGPVTAQGPSESISAGETLRLLAGMINRISVNQLHSQVASTGGPEGQTANQTWILELPWINSTSEVKVIQGRIEERGNEDSDDAASDTSGEGQREWRLNLALDMAGTGPVYFDVSLVGQKLSATIWAEYRATVDLVRLTRIHLESALSRLDLDVEPLECFHGKPPSMVTRLTQQLVDEHA